MNRELLGCLFIASPFIILMVILYICGWAKAIDDYKSKDNEYTRAGLIIMSLFTIVSILVLTGVYLICTK